VQDKLAWVRAHYEKLVPAEVVAAQSSLFEQSPTVSTPEQIVERLGALRTLGMTYAIANFPDAAYDRSSLELFVAQVIPALAD
jgi:hypothetical protein